MTTELSGRRNCKSAPNKYFYVCGQNIVKSRTTNVSEKVRHAHLLYFGVLLNKMNHGYYICFLSFALCYPHILVYWKQSVNATCRTSFMK